MPLPFLAALGKVRDLFGRLTHYEDDRLKVNYTYDALGRRLYKHSQAHYEERREAGPHWNRAERVKHNRELQCGFTLYGWDGDTLAWESKIADEDGFGAHTTSTSPAALCRRRRRCARKPSNCSTSPSTAITTGRMKTRYGCRRRPHQPSTAWRGISAITSARRRS
ncbi:hypothetical protein [Burkholderia diffusa]|uniref:hypothetical protein n=1 Tax=Burkholderia diffusa TaxID=488732 RepID=UPI001FD48D6B|nr:hypothetical protein [Burkholderia diffusa]